MTTQAAGTIDAELVNAFMNATTEVLGTMAQTEVNFKGAKAETDFKPTGDISSVIGITGQKGSGVVMLSFPINVASLIVSRLLGTTEAQVTSEDRCDGIGELANMISGNAKTKMSAGDEEPYKLSLPSVILGTGHSISGHPNNQPNLIMVFGVDEEDFTVQLCFKYN
ncbi:MAG: chemotaxis protein CheX [Vampirovibrio sp.]|nr:chemotaxis protein CheX [Vampirovibrio sp.]